MYLHLWASLSHPIYFHQKKVPEMEFSDNVDIKNVQVCCPTPSESKVIVITPTHKKLVFTDRSCRLASPPFPEQWASLRPHLVVPIGDVVFSPDESSIVVADNRDLLRQSAKLHAGVVFRAPIPEFVECPLPLPQRSTISHHNAQNECVHTGISSLITERSTPTLNFYL